MQSEARSIFDQLNSVVRITKKTGLQRKQLITNSFAASFPGSIQFIPYTAKTFFFSFREQFTYGFGSTEFSFRILLLAENILSTFSLFFFVVLRHFDGTFHFINIFAIFFETFWLNCALFKNVAHKHFDFSPMDL